MWIKGIYKMPAIKHAFFIVAPLEECVSEGIRFRQNKKNMEYFERILRSKDHTPPTQTQKWTLKLVSQNEFLSVLKECMPKGQLLSNQTCDIPESLELLAINLLKNQDNESDFSTRKILSTIPDEDVIEVFI